MPSEAQLKANRRNAKKSTGPKTDEGKERCKMNALKHGFTASSFVIFQDEIDDFIEFSDNITYDLAPRNQTELNLVDKIIADSWRLRRAPGFESEALRALRDSNPGKSIGEVLYESPVHDRMMSGTRAELALERSIFRRMRQLQELRNTPQPTEQERRQLPEVRYQVERQNVDDVHNYLFWAKQEQERLDENIALQQRLRELRVKAEETIKEYNDAQQTLEEMPFASPQGEQIMRHRMWRAKQQIVSIREQLMELNLIARQDMYGRIAPDFLAWLALKTAEEYDEWVEDLPESAKPVGEDIAKILKGRRAEYAATQEPPPPSPLGSVYVEECDDDEQGDSGPVHDPSGTSAEPPAEASTSEPPPAEKTKIAETDPIAQRRFAAQFDRGP